MAIECFENGLIGPEDTDGIELRWGNAAAIVEMTRLIGRREGFGEVLADGAKRAAERIGWTRQKLYRRIRVLGIRR